MSEGYPSGALPNPSNPDGQEAQEEALDCLSLGMVAARERSEQRPLMTARGGGDNCARGHHRHLSTSEPQWQVAPSMKWGRGW